MIKFSRADEKTHVLPLLRFRSHFSIDFVCTTLDLSQMYANVDYAIAGQGKISSSKLRFNYNQTNYSKLFTLFTPTNSDRQPPDRLRLLDTKRTDFANPNRFLQVF